MSEFLVLTATAFGLGLLPLWPGTFGALPGVPFAWALANCPHRFQLIATISMVLLAVPVCRAGTEAFGGTDHGHVVADEFLTFPLVAVGFGPAQRPLVLAAMFAVSRVLDGVKPPPARVAETVGWGAGIVLDDVIANLYTLLLFAVIWLACRRRREV